MMTKQRRRDYNKMCVLSPSKMKVCNICYLDLTITHTNCETFCTVGQDL